MKKILIISLFLLFACNAVSADVLKTPAVTGTISMKDFNPLTMLGFETDFSKKVTAEFKSRTGLDPKKDIERIYVSADLLQGAKPGAEIIVCIEGNYNPGKLVSALTKESSSSKLKIENAGNFKVFSYVFQTKKSPPVDVAFSVISNKLIVWGTPSVIKKIAENNIQNPMGKKINTLKRYDALLSLNFPPAFIEGFTENIQNPMGRAIAKDLDKLRISFKKGIFTLAVNFNSENTPSQLHQMYKGAEAMGLMQINKVRSEAEAQMKDASLFELLGPEILAKGNGAELLENILTKHIKISTKEKRFILALKIPFKANPGTLITATAIVGVLAAIAVPNFQKARSQAKAKACYSNTRVLEGACELFFMESNQAEPPAINELVKKGYLKREPECPEGGKYSIIKQGNNITVKCSVHGSH